MSVVSMVKREHNTKTFHAGETIFSEGDASESMFVLEQGQVQILKGARVLDVIEPEGMFGEMGLVNAKPRSATAIAALDSTVVELNQGDFYFLIQHVPYFAIQVMQILADRVRRNTES